MLNAFNRKWDMATSMYYEDTDQEADTSDPVIDLENITESDLYDTYFRYGIKPEWLQIHRVLSVQKINGEIQYLVKWRELPHVDCTWEQRKARHISEICDIKRHIIAFNKMVKEAIERPDLFRNSSFKHEEYAPYTEKSSFISNLSLQLHNYQLDGLNWIRYSCFNNTNVILADEMGLGKTIQSITFLYSLYKDNLSCGPFLVCAPLSTLPNWEREFELWAPDFYVVTLSMFRENRDVIKKQDFYLDKCSPRVPPNARKYFRFHVLLASYEVIQIESTILRPIKWSVLVLDEAHRIKNKQSKLHQMLADYRFDFKLLLTGTPLQNNLEELFYLLNFLSPKDFANAESFLFEFKDLSKEKQIEKIHNLLGKRLLRRLKSDVLKEIPIKSEVMVPVDLSELQHKYYRAILTHNYTSLTQRSSSNSAILNVLMELKKCCNHPYLTRVSTEDEPIDEESGMHIYNNLVSASSKMVLIDKMLTGLQRMGHRVLIFSQMTRLLDLLEEYLNHKEWRFERIDGSVSTLQRQASIDRFNSKDSQSFIFLLSTRAGGLGINLASADTVIIYDSDWNPHNDIQALSRAHRLGQLKKVMIYRFFTRNTVEERILEVAKKKMMLTHLVVHAKLGKNENLSKRELDDIVKFGTAQLFNNSDDSNQLEYDDDAVNKLLNREAHSTTVQESGINEYFSSFKVRVLNKHAIPAFDLI
ncbi:Chromodomain-helicase-DNA-binding protein 3 [Thelohanellus kitauei]|uniref:Chromodomain-helicase-DNA-binding protein 3 n=1 Tax=Thelohanellus kitauei TaxID=669202 RepID=A0A0C2IG86_THEKT|nr:Chromodomain-helicase-DNA-binding protein 3 [Thelohanellus kitauei]